MVLYFFSRNSFKTLHLSRHLFPLFQCPFPFFFNILQFSLGIAINCLMISHTYLSIPSTFKNSAYKVLFRDCHQLPYCIHLKNCKFRFEEKQKTKKKKIQIIAESQIWMCSCHSDRTECFILQKKNTTKKIKINKKASTISTL